MTQLNTSFNFGECGIDIRFTPANQYGVDRHTVTVHRPMCKPLQSQCFKKTEEEVIQFAKELSEFQTCTCG